MALSQIVKELILGIMGGEPERAAEMIEGIEGGQDAVQADGSVPFTAPVAGVDPVADADLATKNYVDDHGGGISWSTPVNSSITFDTDQTYDFGASDAEGNSIYFANGNFSASVASPGVYTDFLNPGAGSSIGLNCPLDAQGSHIVGLPEPSSAQDAATKNYVDTHHSDGVTTWTKYTFTHTDLSAANTVKNVTAFTLAAKQGILQIVAKSTIAFAGGSISAYSVSVGITSTSFNDYINAYDVHAAVSNTNFNMSYPGSTYNGLVNFGGSTAVTIQAASTGANLDAATAGSVDIYVLTTTLP